MLTLVINFQKVLPQEIPPPPMEWGEVSRAELEMKTFDADTNASAVILCDYGETTLNSYMNLVFKRHLRVKILKEAGFSWATHTIHLYTDRDNGESIDDIEGSTYVLDDNGEIVRTKFDDDDVFEEKIGDKYSRYKFTLPGLQPGCIIEIRYEITAQNFFSARNWTFQNSEPTLWSEYRLIHPVNLGFSIISKGFERFEVEQSENIRQYFSGETASYLGVNFAMCVMRRMAVKNIKAIRNEPYVTTLDDYYQKLEIQFSGYAIRGGGIQRVLNTWEKFVDDMLDSRGIGNRIDITGTLEDIVQNITIGITDPEEKIRAIYKWVSTSIVWTGEQRIFSEQKINDILETKKGSSADINYLFISMVRSVGIQCDPVLLSTRENGKLQDLYPIYDQFNYSLSRIILGPKTLYVDATSSIRTMDVLPSKVLGVKGLIIQPETVEWVTLTSPVKHSSTINGEIAIDENGGATGSLEGVYRGYGNINIRTSLTKEKKTEDVAKEYFSIETSGFTVDSVVVTNTDIIENPLIMKAWVTSPDFCQAGNDILYLNPHITRRWSDNPFKSSARKFPVDYNYPIENTSIVTFTIPDSYVVKEPLRDRELYLNTDIRYRRTMKVDSNIIHVRSTFEVLNKEIQASQYQRLKDLYSSIVAMESEHIVLQKKPSQPPAPVIDVRQPIDSKVSKKTLKKK